MNLSSTIKSIQDIMRKDDGVDGDAQRLGQLTWMLFLKVFAGFIRRSTIEGFTRSKFCS